MLTQPVSGGAKWIKSFSSFDRISHPFGCLLELAIFQQKEPPSGGQTPLERKPCIARYARSHQHSWHCRLSPPHTHKERWTSLGQPPSWRRSKHSPSTPALSSASEASSSQVFG